MRYDGILGEFLDPEDLVWRERAACLGRHKELDFFPERGLPAADVLACCESCPVQSECLDFAMDNNERFGVWGGLTVRARRRLARQRRQEAK